MCKKAVQHHTVHTHVFGGFENLFRSLEDPLVLFLGSYRYIISAHDSNLTEDKNNA